MLLVAPTLTDSTDGPNGPGPRSRVTLRAHRHEDAQGVLEQCTDPLSRSMTAVPADYTLAMAVDFVSETMPRGWLAGIEHGFALEVDGAFGGTVSLRDEGGGRYELAYGAHPAVRGTGAVERGLRLLLEWGFGELGARVVVWRAFMGNWASRKVAWRLGFRVEGTVRRYLPQRGELRDAWVGTLLPDDPREPPHPWLVPPVIDADGVRLRPAREGDVPRIVEGCADPETQRWLGQLPAPYDAAAARTWMEESAERLATGTGMDWVVVDPATDLVLGSVGWFGLDPGLACEVGYWTHPAARGRGVSTRAGAAVLRYAFEELGVRHVRANAALDNTASRRVLERLAMTCTGVVRLGTTVREGPADAALYDVLATEWVASVRR